MHSTNCRKGEQGQTLALFCVLVIAMILMLGIGLDLGYGYITKASLSKAVDSACLTGVRNLYQGQAMAESVARSAFAMNYGSPKNQTSAPVVAVAFSKDASNNTQLGITATATINTFFIRILPQFRTLTVSASAQATRAKLIMSIVLDRSGSMSTNGGGAALPRAVGTFIDFFDDANDNVAMSSFASNATLDMAMRTSFKSTVKSEANSMVFVGGTFAPGGLAFAPVQNDSVPVIAGENVVKVTVFFTDGLANIIQDTLNCGGRPTLINFGGYDSGTTVGFFDPATGTQLSGCSGVTQFRSAINGTMRSLNRANVTADAEYRALQIANGMRAKGTIIYSIGLGNSINQDFLQQIANDPASPSYNPNQPMGDAVFAPAASDLQGVFQAIASKILLRLTR
jgi:Flp pilus assembly protein TadG